MSIKKKRIPHELLPVVFIGLLIIAMKSLATFENVQAGQLMFRNDQGGLHSAVHIESKADITISGFIAHVTLVQDFVNQTDDWQEAVYVFPLSETAAVNFMQMKIGDRLIKAVVREKQEARQIYRQAKAEGKKAGLTEQSRPNLFTQSVANIAPDESIKVEIRFIQSVEYEHGEFSLRFPMTLTPRFIPGIPWATPTDQVPDADLISPPMVYGSDGRIDNPISIGVTLSAGLPLKIISSLYHDITVEKKERSHFVSFRDGIVPMDRNFVLTWQPVVGEEPRAAVFRETVGSEDYLLMMLLPPDESSLPQAIARDMIFVIDTSGSMKGPSIEQAKKSLVETLKRLRPQDRFNVIEFNSSYRNIFHVSAAADPYTVNSAIRWVTGLVAGGGTNMVPALKFALDSPVSETHLKHIVFITDGSVGNENALLGLISDRLGEARLFTVGIGAAPNGYFMRKAAEFGRGTFTYIGQLSEAESRMDALYRKLDSPVVRDIEITWPIPVESYPKKLPALYLNEPLLVVARGDNLQGDIHVSGSTARLPWYQSFSSESDVVHLGVGTLWARSKIESLEDEKIAGRDANEVRQAVLDIALNHDLVTSYTSLVAVEEIVSRFSHDPLRRVPVPNLMPVGQKISAVMYPRTATSAGLSFRIGSMALMLALALMLLRMRRPQVS